MLPDDFQWSDSLGGKRLEYGRRTLAQISQPNQHGCWVTTNPDTIACRNVARPSLEAAMAYVEAWACTWEARIREGGNAGTPLYGPGLMPDLPVSVPTTHPRRSPRRRR